MFNPDKFRVNILWESYEDPEEPAEGTAVGVPEETAEETAKEIAEEIAVDTAEEIPEDSPEEPTRGDFQMDNGEIVGCRDCEPHRCKWQIKPDEWFAQECHFQSCPNQPVDGQFHCLACHVNVTPSERHSKEALVKCHVETANHFGKVTALCNVPDQLAQESVPQFTEKDIMAINQGLCKLCC